MPRDPLDEAIHNDTEKMRLIHRHKTIRQEIDKLLAEAAEITIKLSERT